MALNNITILRQNGGVPATLPGEDHYSGLLVYLAASDMPVAGSGVTGFSATNRIIQISTIEYAESLGIKSKKEKPTDPEIPWILKALHYHLSEAFRINPAIMLWVGLFDKPTGNYDFSEIKIMQNYAEGKIRQIGIYAPENLLTANDLTAIQGAATNLEANDMPLSALYCPKIGVLTGLASFATIGLRNVSILIGMDGDGVAKELFGTGGGKCVGIIGNALGMLSKMAVHESIAWVEKCPTGISTPAFAEGTLVKNIDIGVVNTLNDKRFIFLRTFGGFQGSFYNDNHTMDDPQSDYNSIDRVRVMDKACRGIRTYLLKRLSAPLYADAKTGKLRDGDVAYLTSLANFQLSEMEKAGELSGYVAEIDPNQNVIVSSEVEFVIKNVPVGVMRKMKVKIGYTTKLG